MAKFTPGPWKFLKGVDNYGESDSVLGSIRNEPSDGLSSYHIARIWDDGPSPEADAALIAAAPEMYAALKAAHLMVSRFIEDYETRRPHPSIGYEEARAFDSVARVAIAKAEAVSNG